MFGRLTFVAPARTSAQRHARFPADGDAIEWTGDADASATRAVLGRDQVVVGGPERRVAQTARALGLTLRVHDELTAWAYGSWAGRLVSEVVAGDAEAFAAWRTDPTAGPPGGEPLRALLDRGALWLDGCALDHRAVVLVDSSVIRGVVVHVLGAPPESFWRMDVRPLSTTVLSSDGARWHVRSVGATAGRASERD